MSRDKRQPDSPGPTPPRLSTKERHDADYIVALAAFFVIALAEQEVLEDEAIHDFEEDAIAIAKGDEESPLKPLADWRYWRRWNAQDDGRLTAFMSQRVWPDLRQQYTPSDGPLGLLPDLVDWSELDSNAVESAFVVATQFNDLAPIPLAHAAQIFRDQFFNCQDSLKHELADSFGVPPSLYELVLPLVDTKRGDTIYEPNFQRNGWLIELADRGYAPDLDPNETAYHAIGRRLMERGPVELRECSLHGYQENRRELLLGLVWLMLAGITKPAVRLGCALKNAEPKEQFDHVLATPPMGAQPDWALRHQFQIGAQSSEGLYLEHILERLKPGGRAFVVVPRGLLFREGREQKLREHLLKNFRVDAVILLPSGILKPATSIPAALLVIRRVPPADYVWFITEEHFQQMVEYQMGLMEEDQFDLDLIRAVLRAKLKSGRSAESMQAEFDRLAARIADAEKAEDEEDSVQVRENRQSFLQLGRFFLEEDSSNRQSGRKFKQFTHLIPVDELIRRKSELIWKESGEHTLHVLLERIQKTVPGVHIVRLGDVASGFGYRSEDMVDAKSLSSDMRATAPRLVRVGDLLKAGQDPQNRLLVTPAMRYLRKEAIAKMPQHCILKSGDILFSVTGTVGKVSVVGSTDRQLVAASGVAIIRVSDPILRQYLPALLLTEPYQKWFQGISAGSTIRHLTVRALKETPVPLFRGGVAPTALNYLTPGQRGESILQLLESKPGLSPWLTFLLDEPSVREFADSLEQDATSETKLEILKGVVAGIERLQSGHSTDPTIEPLVDWLAGFRELSTRMLEISALPLGQDRFTALQSWRLGFVSPGDRFKRAYTVLRNRSAHFSGMEVEAVPIRAVCGRAEKLYDSLLRIWTADCQEHLSKTKVTANIAPTVVTVGKPTEMTLTLMNEGVLPLKAVEIHTSPFESRSTSAFLAASGKHTFIVKLTAGEPGKQALNLSWKARRLDDTSIAGEIQLAFESQSLRAAAATPTDSIGENPYIYGRVLEGDFDRMFYGREKDMEKVESQLRRSGPTTVILLEGNRRIGKTSLLKHFVRHRLPEGWLAVFINFQDFDGHQPPPGERTLPGIPTRNIFLGMARELVTAARDVLPALELPDLGAVPQRSSLLFRKFLDNKLPTWFDNDQPFTRFRSLLEIIREAVRPKRLLLILDEFDRIQEGIASGITSDQVPENIRHVFQTYGDIGGIFTGSRTIRRLRQEYWNVLFGLGESHQLRGLEEKAALDLVERPVAGRLVYSPAASRRIIEHCARQPLLIQSICGRLFEVCKETGERTVTVEMVDKVAEEKAGDNEHFETLWGYVRSNRQRCLAFVVDELAEQRGTLAFSAILDATERHGIQFRGAGDLERDLDDLLDLEVLGAHGERRRQIYRIEVPLFSMWLKRTKDFEQYRRAAMEEL